MAPINNLAQIYLLKFNNYYNRILRFYRTAAEYEGYLCEGGNAIIPATNFIPHDGVSTQHDINWNGETPDYILLVDEYGDINSRWYVIESVRLRNGQYRLSLYRDLLADYYEEVVSAPIFVEKATLSANSPLLFNQEDMTFNQIRYKPQLLHDDTKCPWIVGYIARDAFKEGATKIEASYVVDIDADFEVEGISNWEYNKYRDNPGYVITNTETNIRYQKCQARMEFGMNVSNNILTIGSGHSFTKIDSSWGIPSDSKTPATNYNPYNDFKGTYYYTYTGDYPNTESAVDDRINTVISKVQQNTTYQSYLDGFVSSNYDVINESTFQEIKVLQGKIIKDTNSNISYRVNFINLNEGKEEKSLAGEQSIVAALNEMIYQPSGGSVQDKTYTATINYMTVMLSLEQVQTKIYTEIDNNRSHLEDEPYDMFCIPYGRVLMFDTSGFGFYSEKIGTSLAAAIASQSGSANVYDVQILPYCPVQYAWYDVSNYVDLPKTEYDLIYDSERTNSDGTPKRISAVIWCRKSSFSFNIPLSIPDEDNAVWKKVFSQTKKYRLVSPNYGSAFEFDPYKNGGVNYLQVDCSYKPFNPYIRVAPIFNGLYGYGGQYDARGLILQGDFSISQLTNAWADYQLQNKNFEAMFDRQIENLETINKYQRLQERIGIFTGAAAGGVSGGMAGGLLSAGNPYIGAAGAGASAIASGAAGVADYYINEALRKETIDYTKDQFGYNLGNIQALPTALSKTSTLTINNPLVPMLEIYEATYEEQQALIEKIKYNGMTVMTIGTMAQYLGQKQFTYDYFKGKLIRLENLTDDAHVATAIAAELNQGVYI